MIVETTKKKIVCVGMKKDFLPLMDLECKYNLYFYSFSQFNSDVFSFRPDILILSLEKDSSHIPLPFSKDSEYFSTPTICLTSRNMPAVNFIKKGAIDCLEKPVDPSLLAAKIDSHFDYISRFLQVYHNAFEKFRSSAGVVYKPDEFPLTGTEKEIVKYILGGLSNKDISNKMYVTEGTVKNHLTRIYSKCGVKSRYELITLFSRN